MSGQDGLCIGQVLFSSFAFIVISFFFYFCVYMDRDKLIEVEINKGKIKANISSHLDQTNPLHKGFMYELKKQQRRRRLRIRHLTLGRTRKVITPPWYRRGVVDPLLPRFWYVRVFRNGFAFSGKPLIFSSRWGIFYEWWRCWGSVTSTNMVAILDFIKNWKSGRNSENEYFLLLTCKITHK